MSKELFEALNVLEKENNISKEVLFEAIEIPFSQLARTTSAGQIISRFILTGKNVILLSTLRRKWLRTWRIR